MNMTLRDLTTEYQALMDMLNQEEPDLQAISDTLEGLSGEIEEKADNVATMVKEYTYLSEALKNEADNLTQRAKAAFPMAGARRGWCGVCLLQHCLTIQVGGGMERSHPWHRRQRLCGQRERRAVHLR